ncbi:hypothetical protein DFH07DRAFT_973634 [Mycena maculata]|uniref:Uncharacterized protein n=1 Tax=Mycena maculata TaxID=230809 RepID=A0AAD7HC50_9AGAR|nr:hypothetical protein DFH07DRAFT_973634 [Mycena maculata]
MPEPATARDEARSRCSLENTQLLTLSQQLHDAKAVSEGLRTQNAILQGHLHELERARDRAELKLELIQMTNAVGDSCGDVGSRGHSRSRAWRRRSKKNVPGIERVGGKICCEKRYPDGGAMTYWVSDPSTDEDYDRENGNPFDDYEIPRRSLLYRSTSHHTCSHQATSHQHPVSRLLYTEPKWT